MKRLKFLDVDKPSLWIAIAVLNIITVVLGIMSNSLFPTTINSFVAGYCVCMAFRNYLQR